MTQEEIIQSISKMALVVNAISMVDKELANSIQQQHVMMCLSDIDSFDMESMDTVDQGASAIAMGLLVHYCPGIFDDNEESKNT